MVSVLLGVRNGGGVRCCCPAQCSGAARTLLVPLQHSSVLRHVVHCSLRVCGVWGVSVCLWCSRGGVSSVYSPLVVVVGGTIMDGGVA